MNRLAALALLLALFAAKLPAQNAPPTPQKVNPDEVKLTSDPDDVEFCKLLGDVKAKSGWGGSMGCGAGISSVESTVRKRAADLGANVVGGYRSSCEFMTFGSGKAYHCGEEDTAKQQAKLAELQRAANQKIACTTGADCEFKWSRVTLWLANNSKWKFRNITETLITTEGPMETNNPAFEVIKMATGDGKTYQLTMRAACGGTWSSVSGSGCTEKDLLRLRANFADFVLTPPENKQP
jgi:hypothetical protein